ncbi:Variable surface protein Vir7-like protein [Plasmodium coatneyi]|uniref:Variable surface protein Vir7-like protein n=1 Tax=Plasmodium coatneyi TaxID=208452 RepID=A0A1B1E298_9APIC|nr:Variable surface protein Vir7-like protein [Plasmodium coatneyi]ANQ08949.1 Variable surface protein Vir7-like protein [Plasmodium coatneyi]
MYNDLVSRANSHNKDDCNSEVKNRIKEYITDTDTVNNIMRVFCYMYGMNSSDDDTDGKWCKATYYWLGETLSDKLDAFSFTNAMHKCYNEMNNNRTGNKCKFMYTSNNMDVFKALKKVVDFKKDEAAIKEQLGTGVKKKCTEGYRKYLENVKKAYKEVKEKCTDKQNKEYYEEFKELFPHYVTQNELQMECVLTGEEAFVDTRESTFQTSSFQSNSTVPAAVSSIFSIGALGLAATFLLYKNIFSFGRSSSRNNNRSKRRSVRRDLDPLTEDISTTTTDDNSTIGGSTIAEDFNTIISSQVVYEM